MNAGAVGVFLLWLGTLVLVAVLQHRLRHGAFSDESFERPPPLQRWQVPVAMTGMALAAAGIALTLWSFA
ncbi:MAG: hypothetical protein HY985_05005 [Magnetospirillum sp.]|nr:hypothetical protein [Magnetospirillum sp.]